MDTNKTKDDLPEGTTVTASDKPIVDQTIDALVDSAAAVAKVAAKSGVQRLEKAASKTRVGKIVTSAAGAAQKAVKTVERQETGRTAITKESSARKTVANRGASKSKAAKKSVSAKKSSKKNQAAN